jgi:hypothetical protein
LALTGGTRLTEPQGSVLAVPDVQNTFAKMVLAETMRKRGRKVLTAVGTVVSALVTLSLTLYFEEARTIITNLLSWLFHVPKEDVPYDMLVVSFAAMFVVASGYALFGFSRLINWMRRRWKLSDKHHRAKPIELVAANPSSFEGVQVAVLYVLLTTGQSAKDSLYGRLSQTARTLAKNQNVLASLDEAKLVRKITLHGKKYYRITSAGVALIEKLDVVYKL